jgi:SAM-dependent methyltransferase
MDPLIIKTEIGLEESCPLHEKLFQIPAVYYSTWLNKFGATFVGATVLDFGCGEGLATTGISMFCGASRVDGVDICTDFSALFPNLSKHRLPLPSNEKVTFRAIEPCESLGENIYDVIVSWSVLEHVSQEIFDKQIDVLVRSLKSGGYMIVQIAPLYYSPFGSHLFDMHDPWEHLTLQTNLLYEKVRGKCGDNDAVLTGMWNCFATLNRFTDEEFIARLNKAGLEILHVYETDTLIECTQGVLKKIYQTEITNKEQILVVCRKN